MGLSPSARDLATAGVVLAFVLVHLWGGRLRLLNRTPRSVWLSVAGGVSVAYVFLHLLPELREGQRAIEAHLGEALFLAHHTDLLALAGLTIFYGLERLASRSHHAPQSGEVDEDKPTSAGVFAVHIGSFTVYNFIIGVLLVQREDATVRALLLYGLALGLHFLVNDHGLRAHHRARYTHWGRWILAAAVAAGWAMGLLMPLPTLALRVGEALLAGGVIMNVMKEELPRERESRFSAFLAGTVAYSLLLLAVG